MNEKLVLKCMIKENNKPMLSQEKPRDAAAVLCGLTFTDNIH